MVKIVINVPFQRSRGWMTGCLIVDIQDSLMQFTTEDRYGTKGTKHPMSTRYTLVLSPWQPVDLRRLGEAGTLGASISHVQYLIITAVLLDKYGESLKTSRHD